MQSFSAFNFKTWNDCKTKEDREYAITQLMNDGKKKLFVIDNVDHTDDGQDNVQDPLTDTLLGALTGWPDTTIILTSRLDEIEKYATVPITNLNEEACIKVFYLYHKEDTEHLQTKIVRKLVNLVGCHTFAVELIAKGAKRRNLEDYYKQLKNEGIGFDIQRKFEASRNAGQKLNIAEHLKTFRYAAAQRRRKAHSERLCRSANKLRLYGKRNKNLVRLRRHPVGQLS